MTYPVPRRAARRVYLPLGVTRVRRAITAFFGTAGAIGLFLVGMGYMVPRAPMGARRTRSGQPIRGRVSRLTPTPSLWS